LTIIEERGLLKHISAHIIHDMAFVKIMPFRYQFVLISSWTVNRG